MLNTKVQGHSPRPGADNPWSQSFDVNRKPWSLWPNVVSFKMVSLKSDFIHFFNYFIRVYSPRGRADKPLGSKFWCQQKGLIILTICCKFKKNHFEVWFYTYFLMFPCMYIAPGQAQTNPWGQSLDVLITLTICCKFQKTLFEFWFYTHFLMFFHMYIALGQGQTTLCEQNPDVNRKALSLCPSVASFKKISLSDFIHIFACFHICI